MKRFENGEALAKEIGIPVSKLKKTFDDYNAGVKAKKDPFGKKVRVFALTSARFGFLIVTSHYIVLLYGRMEARRLLQRCHHDSRPPLHHGWSRD